MRHTPPDGVGHLIHIGYPKAGSSFLQRWFGHHPQLAYEDGAIAGFANVYAIARAAAGGSSEARYRVTSTESLATPHVHAGELLGPDRAMTWATPGDSERVCATLAALFPTAHVLLVTRGFHAMLRSGYSQYVRSGGDVDLGTLVRGIADHIGALEQWDYDRMIRVYSEAFPGRLIVTPFELLADDPSGFVRDLEERLGLDHAPFRPERVNPSLSAAELRWYPRMSRVVRRLPLRGRLRQRALGLYAAATMRGALRGPARLLDAVAPGSPADDDLSDEILEHFRGRAELLRANPLYEPYAREYLH